VMFVVLKATDPAGLGLAALALLGTLVAVPLALLALGSWLIPFSAGSQFSMLMMDGFAAAVVNGNLGVDDPLGAFLRGLVTHVLGSRVPQLASHDNMRSVKLFSSFSLPFYFFARGAHVPADALSLQALGIGVALTAVLVPLRASAIWAKRALLGIGNLRA